MTLDSDDPNFQIDMGFVDLYIGQVNVIADITQSHFVRQRTPIPFDEEIFDPTNSFFPENSTFVAPWTGSFKFFKENFRYLLIYFDLLYQQFIQNHSGQDLTHNHLEQY